MNSDVNNEYLSLKAKLSPKITSIYFGDRKSNWVKLEALSNFPTGNPFKCRKFSIYINITK